ncbi:hypothetical protein SLS58_000880 [Diplodia intermedia]|uniref:von willebrand domain containing protein n=1 Tax=Diplodia intermedia TaxID=856260 RepID=A0ABR3U379_9PEZI
MAPHQHICGFYYTTPRVDANPWEDQCQRHYLPQLALKSHTTILSRTSRTLLTQTFTNPDQTKAIKNARYTFPLYDGVSVVGFTCRVGDRLIKGQVKEKEKAKSDFNQAVERGQVAGLLEQLPDAADVFTTTVGNIPPGATILAEIAYLGELKHDAEVDGIRFTIPTAIAPRYGKYPGELLSKPAAAQAHASSGMEIVIDAVSDDCSPIKQLRSPTHPISVSMGVTSTAPGAEPTMTKASATLSLGTAELDTDFIIQVVAKDTGNPTAILETHPRIPQQRALMTTLVPKFSLPSIRPEIVFICDRSGSMGSGSKIPTAVGALKLFLKSLPVGVKFNICSFGSRYTFLWPKSKSYSQDSLEEAIKHVQTFDSDYGGTEILEPLKATFENRYKDMELEIMLLTDGDVWGHGPILAYLNEHIYAQKEPVRVFTLGVGLDASSALVEGIARAGNGFSQAVGDNEKMDRKIVRMLKGALSPHITDYSLEVKYADEKQGNSDDGFELVEKVTDSLRVNLNLRDTEAQHEAGVAPKTPISLFDPSVDVDAPEPHNASNDGQDRYAHLPPLDPPAILQAPSRIPALFPFNRSTVYLLLSPNSPAANRTPSSVILRGTSSHGPLELEIPVTIASENNGKGETVHQLAARKAVSELEEGRGWLSEAVDATGAKLKEKMEGRWDEMVEREAVRLGVRFQVGGKWCSFVALEQNPENQDAEPGRDWEYLDGGEPIPSAATDDPSLADYQQSVMLLRQERAAPRVRCMMMASPSARPGGGGGAVTKGFRQRVTDKLGQQHQPAAAAAAAAVSAVNPADMQLMSSEPMGAGADPLADDDDEEMGFGLFDGDGPPAPPPAAPAKIQSRKAKRRKTARNTLGAEVDEEEDGGAEAADASSSPLQRIVALQTFEGSWELDRRLLGAVGGLPGVNDGGDGDDSMADAMRALGCDGPAADGAALLVVRKVAATALAVAFLRLKVAEEEEAWELVVEKAEDWLIEGSGVGEEVVRALKEKAEALVKGKE